MPAASLRAWFHEQLERGEECAALMTDPSRVNDDRGCLLLVLAVPLTLRGEAERPFARTTQSRALYTYRYRAPHDDDGRH